MSKITRASQKIFGASAGGNQMEEFGSLAAGLPVYVSPDNGGVAVAAIQSLSNYLTGWFGGVVGANLPSIQDLNALCYLFAYQIAYGFQAGVPEWDAGTTYYIGSVVSNGTGVLYASLTDTNLNNAVSSTANWKVLSSNVFTTLGDTMYSAANGVPTRLAGNSTTTRKWYAQTGAAGPVSAAPAWTSLPSPTMTVLSSSGTYTPPAGCVGIRIRMNGGGGGAGGLTGASSSISFGCGGGGGGYIEKMISSLAASYSYSVGAGGAGGATSAFPGTDGGDTTFGSFTAGGGKGGLAVNAAVAVVVSDAILNGVAGSATGGDVNVPGQAGIPGFALSITVGLSGAGGSSKLGTGGPGLATIANGSNGTGYGAGGSGGLTTTTGNKTGGSGSNGTIIVEEFYT